ncbi:12951_t:CDS:2 [Cetraspora pellucida]|uniref:12951_t:CDS:1 n=1 Tax=Cetraspora pellucida TaxID=1433469 RepID=A0A9N9B5J3_9GLOM|nr:12951_t:CDS:2 [Cetraspora pellucida]
MKQELNDQNGDLTKFYPDGIYVQKFNSKSSTPMYEPVHKPKQLYLKRKLPRKKQKEFITYCNAKAKQVTKSETTGKVKKKLNSKSKKSTQSTNNIKYQKNKTLVKPDFIDDGGRSFSKKVCSLGKCGDLHAYNVCKFKRPFGYMSDIINIFEQDKNFVPVDRRFYSIPLLQKKNKVGFTSFELLDFVAQIKMVSFNPNNLNDKANIPGTNIPLTKLLSPFKIDFYFVRICDKDLVKKEDLTIEDVLIDPTNISEHEINEEKITPIMHFSVVILCEGCVFKPHIVTICREFEKEEKDVCILSTNTNESIIYNIANYRLFIIVDYMDDLYQACLNSDTISVNEKINLGTPYGGFNAGYPVYFTKFEAEIAYAPAVKNHKNLSAFAENVEDSNEQIPDEEDSNEQIPDEEDSNEQIPEDQNQIPEQNDEQIPDNTILIENLKKAIKDSNLEDLFLNEQIYNNIANSLLIFEEKSQLQDERKQELNNRINEMINETENIDNLKENQVIDNLIKRSDITFHGKNLLQQNRKVKLNELQQDLLQYYKEIINNTDVSLQLREIQLAIGNEIRLTAEQKVVLFDLVNEKYQKSIQQEKINNINEKISKESNIVKLQVDIKDEIDDDNDLTFQQKRELHNIRNEKIRNLCGNTELTRFQEEIENESFFGNLIDRGHYDKMIQLNASLNEDQKKILQDLRKQRLVLLINKNYDSLLNEIRQSKDIERLKDGGYYVNRIKEVRQEYLTNERTRDKLDQARRSRLDSLNNIERLKDDGYYVNQINKIRQKYLTSERTQNKLDQARRSQLDSLYGNDENQSYDLLLELIHNSENINEILSDSEISKDIQMLNQTLLTGNRDLVLLENTRKQNYNDGLYDILKSAIENENNIDKLKTTWMQAIEKIEYEYLTNERNKTILQELLNKRIQYLQQLEEVPKQESNQPTTNPDKADLDRNLAGTVDQQITYIINQYKKTLSAEDQRKYFPRTKTKTVSEIIKKAYDTIQDK